MKWILCRIAGFFCLASGLAPLFYGIFNVGCAALLALGAFLLFFRTVWTFLGQTPRFRAFCKVCIILGATVACGISVFMAHRAWFVPPPAQGPATVIVLGAKVTGTQPSLMLRRRLNKAYDYMTRNPDAVCIVTGGQGPDEDFPEADVMADYLEYRGIAADRISRENQSSSTQENFRFAAEFLEEGQPVVIVTDSFHQLRATLLARAELKDKWPSGFYSLSSSTPWGLFPMYWMRDLCGVAFTWVSLFFA